MKLKKKLFSAIAVAGICFSMVPTVLAAKPAPADFALSAYAAQGVRIDLSEYSVILEAGKTVKLTAKVTGAKAEDIEWIAEDPEIATVDRSGVVTGVKPGRGMIMARIGSANAICTIYVEPAEGDPDPNPSVRLSETELNLEVGETAVLTAEVKNADEKDLFWMSNDSDVATVKNGTVTAVSEGRATIVAKIGRYYAECEVCVGEAEKPVVEVNKITLSSDSLKLKAGKSATLTAKVFPDNAADKTVAWQTSNKAVATVNNGRVHAVAEGTAVITAKAGNVSAECTVTVMPAAVKPDPTNPDHTEPDPSETEPDPSETEPVDP